MIMGNRTASWNGGLLDGYPSFVLNLLFSGAGFVCFSLCGGEMSSALPFSGEHLFLILDSSLLVVSLSIVHVIQS